jgi:hypothetical protein
MLIDGRGIDPTCRRLGEVLGGYNPFIPIKLFSKKNFKKNSKKFAYIKNYTYLCTQ